MKRMFNYDVDIHFKGIGWDTYTVQSDCIENARYKAIGRVIEEAYELCKNNAIDEMRIYREGTDKLLKEYSI